MDDVASPTAGRRMRSVGPTAALAAALMLCGAAGAPSLADAQASEAKTLFRQGVEALRAGRFPEARDRLRRSLRLVPRAPTAFNLVVALRGVEDPLGADAVCDRLLDGDFGELEGQWLDKTRRVCASARADIAELAVRVSGTERMTVLVDGDPIGTAADGDTLRHRVNPGRHVVRARAEDHASDEQVVVVERGGTGEASLRLVLLESEAKARRRAWGIAGGAAAVVAAAVVTGVLLAGRGSNGPEGDFPVTETLRME